MTLFVTATPIGNLEDITKRAIRILSEVDLIAAEDTRETVKLLKHYNINTPLTSYHKFNIKSKTPYLIKLLKEGKNLALVSDAGTPGISDPGEELVKAAVQEKIEVVPVPGPSSITAALSVSGLPAKSFTYLGFLPKKAGKRSRILKDFADRPETLIIFESPYRLEKCLNDLLEILGDREIVVGREITKKFEEMIRGNISSVLKHFHEKKAKGEAVILVAPLIKSSSFYR